MTVWPALGTTLKVDKTGGTSPTTVVGQIMSIDGPSSEVGSVETTNLASTFRQWRYTIADGGELNMEIEYDPTDTGTTGSHGFLKSLLATPQMLTWQVCYPTTPPATDTFLGFMTKLGRSAGGPEENLLSSFTIKINGPVT